MTARLLIMRGAVAVISFSTVAVAPAMSIWRVRAMMPITVSMQVPRAVATRSVGEKLSPRPWLSLGASVLRSVAEGPWTALQ